MPLRRVFVWCGPNPGTRPELADAVATVGRLLVENGIVLVYSAAAAEPVRPLVAAVAAGGGTTIVAGPEELSLADGFLALAGGLTRLDALFEAGPGDKPCGLLNTADYYTGLLETMDDAILEKLVRESQRGRVIVDREPDSLLRAMADYLPPETRRNRPELSR